MDDYLELNISIDNSLHELLTAELLDIGCESFLEEEGLLKAYIRYNLFNETKLKFLLDKFPLKSSYQVTRIPNKNWNQVWETQHKPIIVEGECLIRASFHQDAGDYPFEIVIDPKMSFGTGHHATTYLMIKAMLDHNFKDAKVLDVGTGTGILSILASKMGSESVIAIDNDPQAISNCSENLILNKISNVKVRHQPIEEFKGKTFDFILSNLTRNINIISLTVYKSLLKPGGCMILSGFYEKDNADLIDKLHKKRFNLIHQDTRNDWSVICAIK